MKSVIRTHSLLRQTLNNELLYSRGSPRMIRRVRFSHSQKLHLNRKYACTTFRTTSCLSSKFRSGIALRKLRRNLRSMTNFTVLRLSYRRAEISPVINIILIARIIYVMTEVKSEKLDLRKLTVF